ncbi:MAG: hypothetical protein ACYTX0_55190, partial [Nostoc sp.]
RKMNLSTILKRGGVNSHRHRGTIAIAKAVRTVGGKRPFNSVLYDFIAVLSYLSVAIPSVFTSPNDEESVAIILEYVLKAYRLLAEVGKG